MKPEQETKLFKFLRAILIQLKQANENLEEIKVTLETEEEIDEDFDEEDVDEQYLEDAEKHSKEAGEEEVEDGIKKD